MLHCGKKRVEKKNCSKFNRKWYLGYYYAVQHVIYNYENDRQAIIIFTINNRND